MYIVLQWLHTCNVYCSTVTSYMQCILDQISIEILIHFWTAFICLFVSNPLFLFLIKWLFIYHHIFLLFSYFKQWRTFYYNSDYNINEKPMMQKIVLEGGVFILLCNLVIFNNVWVFIHFSHFYSQVEISTESRVSEVEVIGEVCWQSSTICCFEWCCPCTICSTLEGWHHCHTKGTAPLPH